MLNFFIDENNTTPVGHPPAMPMPVAKPMPMAPAPVVTNNPPVVASGPVQPPQTSTSWAAAAGKGLPTTTHNEASHTNNTSTTSSASGQNANGSTSKHLEQVIHLFFKCDYNKFYSNLASELLQSCQNFMILVLESDALICFSY